MPKQPRKLKKKSYSQQASYIVPVAIATISSLAAFYQNRFGQFSDVRGFYQLHFADGQHHWPFSYHTLLGLNQEQHPVEYPALTGLIMWLISFLVKPAQFAWHQYLQITAYLHVVLFSIVSFILAKVTNKKYAILFSLSPAVLYSLNRNWDIWAIPTMLLAISLFDRKKYFASSVWLAISIATKFFPVILLFPITIYFLRERSLQSLLKYVLQTSFAWFLINFPFALINFSGWLYFYKFNFNRGLGSASIWDLTSKLGVPFPYGNSVYLILNLAVFCALGTYLLKRKSTFSLIESAFITMAVLFLFNKQYSMQYVIWLTSLAVIAMHTVNNRKQEKSIFLFFTIWQFLEIVFQYSFFQNILTIGFPGQVPGPEVSDFVYGVNGLLRYAGVSVFMVIISRAIYRNPSSPRA